MNFHKGNRRPPIEYEKDIASYWRDQKTFEKSVQQRPDSSAYIFYDGPPFITGVPHYGTLLSSVVKDAVTRYFAMKGKILNEFGAGIAMAYRLKFIQSES